ncbi:MAG: HAMP domain-containing sensor histidine kinase [Planctomycetota bacterium]
MSSVMALPVESPNIADPDPIAPREASPRAAIPAGDDLWGGFRELDRQLDAIRRELARHHRLTTLGTMAATIAHEINNVLTPVGSYAQLALARPDDPELTGKALRHAAKGAAHAARIAEAVLGLAGDPAESRSADVAGVAEEAAACLVREPSRDGIELRHAVPAGLAAAIEPGKLRQVLLNLMLNACKAMRQRGGRLTVEAELVGQGVLIRLRDTGPGIPEAVRERLFEPFVTAPIGHDADATSARSTRGTGLGLTVCRQLVEQAGGTIACDTRSHATEPTGTTFTITLPHASGTPEPGEPAAPAA